MTVDRDELKQLCELATPGPWVAHESRDKRGAVRRIYRSYTGSLDPEHLYTHEVARLRSEPRPAVEASANARFIAAARSAVPELLAENERLLEALKGAELALAQLLRSTDEATGPGWRRNPDALLVARHEAGFALAQARDALSEVAPGQPGI